MARAFVPHTLTNLAVTEPAEHWVQFYETESFLVEKVVRFLRDGLAAGEPVVVVATRPHGERLTAALAAGGIDVAYERSVGRFVLLDAAETLAMFMVDGAPDAERFEASVGATIARVAAQFPGRVRAYGEMVDVLWRSRQQRAAIQLEHMWNDLRSKHVFTLLCAYVIDSFYKENRIHEICATHSHVLPLEGVDDFLENAAVAIHRVDRDGIIRWTNAAELVMLGYEHDEYVGHHISEFHVDKPVIREILARLANGETVDTEARVRHKDGSIRWLQINSNAQMRGGEFISTRCFSRDVTAQKEAEANLMASRAEVERASRAKDEFLAMLGHELRNPLSPILTAVQLMRLRGDGSSSREQNIVERQVNHLIHIVDDLLDISRITRGKIQLDKRPIKVASVLTKALEIAGPACEERKHAIAVAIPDEEIWIEADETRLCQVVTNLLTNAAKYSPQGGRIAVRVARDGKHVVIGVKDRGNGIAPDLLPRIFDLFVQGARTTERAKGGLGIGLALVRSLVEMHGGTVNAASDGIGHGSEFTIRLPAIELATEPSLEMERRIGDRVAVTARRILVVDDNEDACSLMGEMLQSVGHEVVVAYDGPHALEAVKRFRPDIAILDIGLPEMDGYQLAAALRAQLGPVRLIALTGYGQGQDRLRTQNAGFEAHFVKPVGLHKVLAAIEVAAR
jgi:PAS domain S-box-containing protein